LTKKKRIAFWLQGIKPVLDASRKKKGQDRPLSAYPALVSLLRDGSEQRIKELFVIRQQLLFPMV
jgi:hypothetical protein